MRPRVAVDGESFCSGPAHIDWTHLLRQLIERMLTRMTSVATPDSSMSSLFARASDGDETATDALFSALYAELHRLARREAARLGTAAPLGATTLLHEAYLDLSQRTGLVFPDRARFTAYAARAMRGIVIDRVRERCALKRGGGLDITSLDTEIAEQCAQPELLPQIGQALDELAQLEPALAHVVDLKFFCGFSVLDIAQMTGTSERTVQRQWEKARAWLFNALQTA